MAGRVVTAAIMEACAKYGLKKGFYYSVDEWSYPQINGSGGIDIVGIDGAHPFDPATDSYRMLEGKIPVNDYIGEYMLPQFKGFIDQYDPDYIFFDGSWGKPSSVLRTQEMVAYFYNKAHGRKDVAVNDRFGKGTEGKIGDFYSSEYDVITTPISHKWEECRSLRKTHAFGYSWKSSELDMETSQQLIEKMVFIISRGGNLLFDINPNAHGTLSQLEVERLLDLGEWLRDFVVCSSERMRGAGQVNGEAIYGTRVFGPVQQQGNTYFTRSKNGDYLYATSLSWPGTTFTLNNIKAAPGSMVTMLGSTESLSWIQDGANLVINIPSSLQSEADRPSKFASVFKIRLAPPFSVKSGS